MLQEWMPKIIVAVVTNVVLYLIYRIIRIIVAKKVKYKKNNRHYKSVARKIIKYTYVILALSATLLIFGYDLTNATVTIGGILGLIAVGFIAVWSILSNIIATFIILITKPFEIDDYIKLLPDKIEGHVDEITLWFTILKDKKGSYIHIPNNHIFQKYLVHEVAKDRK